jgi:hypothetical protein
MNRDPCLFVNGRYLTRECCQWTILTIICWKRRCRTLLIVTVFPRPLEDELSAIDEPSLLQWCVIRDRCARVVLFARLFASNLRPYVRRACTVCPSLHTFFLSRFARFFAVFASAACSRSIFRFSNSAVATSCIQSEYQGAEIQR